MTPAPPHSHTPTLTRTDLFAFLLLALVALAFCWPIFSSDWIIPQGGGDLVSFLWPTYRYAARALHSQSCVPQSTIFNLQSAICNLQSAVSALLWNPTLYSGAPFAADNQTGLFYPPNLLLFLLFPDLPYTAMEALVAFHLFLAGAGMYLLIRHELAPFGIWKLGFGIFPALAFMASDVFITHLGNLNIVAVSSYLPLIFLCLRQSLHDSRVTSHESLRWSILTGLSLGLAALAGHAQMTFILAFACACYGLYELIRQRSLHVLFLGALSALVAFGIAAIALLPALEMLRYTARSALDYAEASRWSLPPLGLAGMISPLVFGRGARDFWPPWDRVEFGYVGVVALTLALLAPRNKKFGIWLLGFGIFSLFIAFGKYTPVHYALYKLVPGFSSIRVPARFILLTNFSLAVLAGYSFVEKPRRPLISLTLFGLAAAFFLLAADLSFGRQPAWQPLVITLALIAAAAFLLNRAPQLLPLLLFAELFAFGGFVEIDRADPDAGYRRGPAVEYLLSQPGPTRIDLATAQWQPDAPAVFGLESITGLSNPLALAAYDRYYWSVGYRGSPQYNFLNAQFVVADKNSPPADYTFVPVFDEDPDVDVYLNTNAIPRVSLIYDPIFAAGPDSAFAAIHTPTFNPASQVVLESRPPDSSTTRPPDYSTPRPPDYSTTRLPDHPTTRLPDYSTNIFYTSYSPGQFTVVAQTPSPAYLVFSEVWYPGWRATINGEPAPILRADTAFMAVLLPAGESAVSFRFTSPMLTLGVLITLITLVLSISVLFRNPHASRSFHIPQ